MDKNETIHDRITQLVNRYGDGKNTVFASIIGSNEANVRGYRTSTMPKFDFLEKIARNLDINLDWLLTGRGQMEKMMSPCVVMWVMTMMTSLCPLWIFQWLPDARAMIILVIWKFMII